MMMPIIIPVSHGDLGPWTSDHTKVTIALTLALGLCWVITLLLNYLVKRKDCTFREIVIPLHDVSFSAWVITDILGVFFLFLAGMEIVGGISYLIYSII